MPARERNFFGGYYAMHSDSWRNFYGVELLHAYDCGKWIEDGKEYTLVYSQMCKDDLPDTMGRNCETCDMSAISADLDQQPIMAALLTDPASALAMVPPCVAELLMQDVASGLGPFEIAEIRAGVLVPEFMGFTFAQVLAWRPDIYQPTVDEEGNEIPNIRACSLEDQP